MTLLFQNNLGFAWGAAAAVALGAADTEATWVVAPRKTTWTVEDRETTWTVAPRKTTWKVD